MRDRLCVDAFAGQEGFGIVHVVNARWLDVDGVESGTSEFRHVVVIGQRTGHAADPEFQVLSDYGGRLAPRDPILHSEAAAPPQHPEELLPHALPITTGSYHT